MLQELGELENIGTRYSQIRTLLDTVCQEYFSDIEPNMVQIQVGYESITDLLFLAGDLMIEQNKLLAETINRLFKTYREMKQWNSLAEKLFDAKENFTKEQKAEYIQCLRESKEISPRAIRRIGEFLDEEEFIKQELFLVEKQKVGTYSEDNIVDAIMKKYPVNKDVFLYNRGYIQGVRAERARRKKPPFYEIKHKIMVEVNQIQTERSLKSVLAFAHGMVGGAVNA